MGGAVTLGSRTETTARRDGSHDRLRMKSACCRKSSSGPPFREAVLETLVQKETVKMKTRGSGSGLIRTAIIAGGAYLLGARAGRERYDQIIEKTKSLKHKTQERFGGPSDGASWEGTSISNADSASVPKPLGTVHLDEPSGDEVAARPDSLA